MEQYKVSLATLIKGLPLESVYIPEGDKGDAEKIFINSITMIISVIIILLITECTLSRYISDRHMFLHSVCSTAAVSQTFVPKHRSPILLAIKMHNTSGVLSAIQQR